MARGHSMGCGLILSKAEQHRRAGGRAVALLGLLVLLGMPLPARAENLFADPSFEEPKDPDQFGIVFAKWGGWIYEQPAQFAVGTVARTGKSSCGMIGDEGCKIRLQSPQMTLGAGRYRVKVFLRGLGIGKGRYGKPLDFSVGFDNKFFAFKKCGAFGWTPLTYVFDVPGEVKNFRLFVGLHAGGRLWVDDASLEKVDAGAELTPEPVFGEEEKPIAAPAKLEKNAFHCPDCAYLNNPDWKQCYACGRALAGPSRAFDSPTVKVIADFENGKKDPFEGGKIVEENVPRGKKALLLEKDYLFIHRPQDWSQHDYLLFDVFNPGQEPVKFYFEVRDVMTKGYWTRVNLETIAPPGPSTITIPTALYVGEKSRPGRSLLRDKITMVAIGTGGKPLIFDNFRLERLDTSAVKFDGLLALDFGRLDSPVMEGFMPVTAGLEYAEGRGLGWQNADIWRSFNVLQPDALYEDFVCPRGGAFRVDLPNGKYHVIMNIDSPGGFWGEAQRYRQRVVKANGKSVVDEKMDLESFKKRYFRNAAREDLPGIDTFKEYVEPMFDPKQFDVDVADGKLELAFNGDGWAICLSALVIYPADKAEQGRKFWEWVTERRRRQFNDYFKQIQPKPTGAAAPAGDYCLFSRNFMVPVNAFDGPAEGEAIPPEGLSLTVAQGEEAALTFSVQPSGDLGQIDLEFSAFTGPGGAKLPPEALQGGWVDYRITRVTMDGAVYSVQPRYWRPVPAPAAPKVTRTFWIRTKVPLQAAAGKYTGKVTVKPKSGPAKTIPVAIRVLPFSLDPISDVAAGPWGSSIDLPWFGDDQAAVQWQWQMFEKVLDALREAGCTSFSGRPTLKAKAANGKIELDFAQADKEMALIRSKGFDRMLSAYGSGAGLGYRPYGGESGPDEDGAKAAGFADAASFISALYKALDEHAAASKWSPVAWNLCDEPVDAAIQGSTLNALAHRKVAPELKQTFFMGATSMTGNDPNNPHYALVKALPIVSVNTHDEPALKVIKDAGNRFSFYNGGNRWTFGRYMKMLVVKHQLVLRLTWHLNAIAGDPYYALDCREDDYCWFNTDADQRMVPSVNFLGNMLPGLNDYRYLSTLQRLLKEKPNHPAAAEGRKVFDGMIDLTAGKDRNVFEDRRGARVGEYEQDREAIIKAIEALLAP